MSKAKLKFIIANVFCGIFILTMPAVAMKKEKISLNKEDMLFLENNNKDLKINEQNELQKNIEMLDYYNSFFDLVIKYKDSDDNKTQSSEYIKINGINKDLETKNKSDETILEKWEKDKNNYYYKRVDVIDHYIKANKIFKILKNMKNNSLVNSEDEKTPKPNKDEILKKAEKILPQMEETIKEWILKYDLYEQGEKIKKIIEASNQIQIYYFHLSNVYNQLDFNKNYTNFEEPIIKLDESKKNKKIDVKEMRDYLNIENDIEFKLFCSSDIFKKYYNEECQIKKYYLHDLEGDIRNIFKIQKETEEYMKSIQKKEGFISEQFEKTNNNIDQLKEVIKNLVGFLKLTEFEDKENKNEEQDLIDNATIINDIEKKDKINLNYIDITDLSEINIDDDITFRILPGSEYLSNHYLTKNVKYYKTREKEKLLDLYSDQLDTYCKHFKWNNAGLEKRLKSSEERLKSSDYSYEDDNFLYNSNDFSHKNDKFLYKSDECLYNSYINTNQIYIVGITARNLKLSLKYRCINGMNFYKIEYLFEDFLNANKIIKDAEKILSCINKKEYEKNKQELHKINNEIDVLEKTVRRKKRDENKKTNAGKGWTKKTEEEKELEQKKETKQRLQEKISKIEEPQENIGKIKNYIVELKKNIKKCRLKYMIDEYGETINLARLVIKTCKEAIQKKLESVDKDQKIDDVLLNDIENILTIALKLKRYINILTEEKTEEAKEKGDDFIYTQFELLFEEANKEIEEIENGRYLNNNLIKQKAEGIKNEIEKDINIMKKDILNDDLKKFLKEIKESVYEEESEIEEIIRNDVLTEYRNKNNKNNIESKIEDSYKYIKIDELNNFIGELNKNITGLNNNQQNQNLDILNLKNSEKIDLDDLSEFNLKEMKGKKVRVINKEGELELNPKYYDTSNIYDLLDLYIEQLECYNIHFKKLFIDNNNARYKKNKKIVLLKLCDCGNGTQNYFMEYPKKVIKEFSLNDTFVSNNVNEFEHNLDNVMKGSFLEEILKKNISIGYKYLKKRGRYDVKDVIEDFYNIQKIISDIDNDIMPLINNLDEKTKRLTLLKEKISEMFDIIKENIEHWRKHYVYGKDNGKYNEDIESLYNYVDSCLFFLNNLDANNRIYYDNKAIDSFNFHSDNYTIAKLQDYRNFEYYKKQDEVSGYFKKDEIKHILKDESVFDMFKKSYFYLKRYEGFDKSNGYYTLENLIDDLADITIMKDKIKEYIEISTKYEKMEAKQNDSYNIYEGFGNQLLSLDYKINTSNYGLKAFIDRLIEKFKIEQKVKDAIAEKLEEQKKIKNIKGKINIEDVIFNSFKEFRKAKEEDENKVKEEDENEEDENEEDENKVKIIRKYDLKDLSQLDLSKIKNAKVRIIKEEKDEDEIKYYDISNKTELLDLYIDQLDGYVLHFKTIFEENKYDPYYDNEHSEDIYVKYNISNMINFQKISNINRYIRSKYENNGSYFKRKYIVEDANNLCKIYKNVDMIIESIEKSGSDFEKNKLKEKQKDISSIRNKLNGYLNKIVEWGYLYNFDEDNKKINDKRNEMMVYYWHFFHIDKYYMAKKDDLKDDGIIAHLKKFREDYYDYYSGRYLVENYYIFNKNEFNIFKSSEIYKNYYEAEKEYCLEDLENDIKYIENFIENLLKDLRELEKKRQKKGKIFTYRQFIYLYKQTIKEKEELTKIIEKLKNKIIKEKTNINKQKNYKTSKLENVEEINNQNQIINLNYINQNLDENNNENNQNEENVEGELNNQNEENVEGGNNQDQIVNPNNNNENNQNEENAEGELNIQNEGNAEGGNNQDQIIILNNNNENNQNEENAEGEVNNQNEENAEEGNNQNEENGEEINNQNEENEEEGDGNDKDDDYLGDYYKYFENKNND